MAQTQWIKITTFTMDSGKHPLRSRLLLRLGIILLLPVLLLLMPAGAAETTPPKTVQTAKVFAPGEWRNQRCLDAIIVEKYPKEFSGSAGIVTDRGDSRKPAPHP